MAKELNEPIKQWETQQAISKIEKRALDWTDILMNLINHLKTYCRLYC